MTTIVWEDVFRWVGMIVCGAICLTPLWVLLYHVFMVHAFSGAWPWTPLVERIQEKRRKR